MIVREWRGRADHGRESAYPMHFRTHVIPELRHISGFMGADLLQRRIDDGVEFTVITRWASMDAVSRFAGSDPAKAVVEPGAVQALRDFDDRVSHHDVLESVEGEEERN